VPVPRVDILDFRVTDRVLAETDPSAGDVVFLGRYGHVAHPFVVLRRIAGPGGTYIDAVEIIDADGRKLGEWEKRFELDGDSKPRTIVSEFRDISFPAPGTYAMQYSIFDDVVATFPFTVAQEAGPAHGIVPGPLDAALSKSTIVWLSFGDPPVMGADRAGKSVKEPRYTARLDHPVWYGYENGSVFVLVGPGEQQVPGVTASRTVHLTARSKDVQSRVATAECTVQVLRKDAEWDRIARDLLVGRRLNLTDGDKAVDRWRKDCEIVLLQPVPPPVPEEAEPV